MLAIRILLGLIGIVLVLSFLGYAINRDHRWLRFAGLAIKAGVALALVLLIALLLERLVMFV
ncbi:MAG TPA: hypothetical protein VF811_07700 [Parasulfuritortus sp.]